MKSLIEESEEERFIDSLSENASEASLFFDDEDILLSINNAARRLLDLSAAEIVGKSWSDIVTLLGDEMTREKNLSQEESSATLVSEDGAPLEFEIRFLRHHSRVIRQRIVKRRPSATLLFMRKLKEALPEGDPYKSFLDYLSDGVYVADRERRLCYWNRGAETITGYSSEEAVGKFCYDNLLRHMDDKGCELCLKGCPLQATLEDGEPRSAEVTLQHKKGHRVPVVIRTTALRDANGEIIGAIETFNDITEKYLYRRKIEELERLALLDPLTGLPNRRCLMMRLEEMRGEWERSHRSFGALFCDIDHFKDVNDRYGHDIGDETLKMVGRTLLSNFRLYDVIGRWGGEEFIAVISGVTQEKLLKVARRLKILVNHSSLNLKDGALSVTLSMGATICREGESTEGMIERADQLMYQSKLLGRNRVTYGP